MSLTVDEFTLLRLEEKDSFIFNSDNNVLVWSLALLIKVDKTTLWSSVGEESTGVNIHSFDIFVKILSGTLFNNSWATGLLSCTG